MSGLEVLTVVAGVAACISAFADARQLYKDWKSKRDRSKNDRRVMRTSKVRNDDDANFNTAVTLYSEYVAGYFHMVSELEGETWLQGDEICLKAVTTQLRCFREEVLVVLESKANDAVVIDWVTFTSVTMKVGFEYMTALDGQFKRISGSYFLHQSIIDVRAVGTQIKRLENLSSRPTVEYEWHEDAANDVLIAAGLSSRDDLSRDTSDAAREAPRAKSSSGNITLDNSKLGLCGFAIELLQDPCKMLDRWTWDEEAKEIKYFRGGLPYECPRCQQPFYNDGAVKHSKYHIQDKRIGHGDLTPRFFARHHLPKTENEYTERGATAYLREAAKADRHACIYCFMKKGYGGEYDHDDFKKHVLGCENWEWYKLKWYSLTKVPDIDYHPCPRGKRGNCTNYDESEPLGQSSGSFGYIDRTALARRDVIRR